MNETIWITNIISQAIQNYKDDAVGRPTVINEGVIGKLAEARSKGCNDIEACLYAWIHQSTLYDFQTKYPKFIEYKETIKRNTPLHAKMNVNKAIVSGDVKTSQRYLEKTDKEFQWNDKQQVSISFSLAGAFERAEIIEWTETKSIELKQDIDDNQ